MPFIDITNLSVRARMKKILEEMFWFRYLKFELKPYIPPIPDPRPFQKDYEPEPQTNLERLLISELFINQLKYTNFKKNDTSLLAEIKKSGLAKEVLKDMQNDLSKAASLIKEDFSIF